MLLKIVLIIIGLLFSIRGVSSFLLIRRARNWVKVPTCVLSADLEREREAADSANIYRYFPKVVYSYEFDNIPYEGTQIFLDVKSCKSYSKKSAEKLLNEIRDVEHVFVNLNQPKKAVIFVTFSKERKSHYLALIIGGLLLTLIGIFLVSIHTP